MRQDEANLHRDLTQIALRIPRTLLERARALARSEGMNTSQVLRKALLYGLREIKKKARNR